MKAGGVISMNRLDNTSRYLAPSAKPRPSVDLSRQAAPMRLTVDAEEGGVANECIGTGMASACHGRCHATSRPSRSSATLSLIPVQDRVRAV
jgi:hypothetical protein